MGGRIKASKVTTKDLVVETSMTIGGATVSADGAELNALNITAAGTVEASKAVVVDANLDAGDFRNLDCTNLDAGKSGTAGTVDIFPATAANGKLIISCTNQGGAHNATLNMDAQTQACTVHIPDPGAVANSYVMLSNAAAAGITATAAEINTLASSGVVAADMTKLHALTAMGADGLGFIGSARFTFDPSADAAMRTAAAHTSTLQLPVNAIVLGGFLEVNTVFTSTNSTATIKVGVEADNDIIAQAQINGAPWSSQGLKAIIPVFTNATYKKCTAPRNITVTVGTEALLTGKFTLVLVYSISAANV